MSFWPMASRCALLWSTLRGGAGVRRSAGGSSSAIASNGSVPALIAAATASACSATFSAFVAFFFRPDFRSA